MKRILIIDDSKSIQKTLSWRLKKRGYEIAGTASDGDEGVRLYQSLKPDLTILDITMPNRDGRECLKDILAHDPAARVVMLSAIDSRETMEQCLALGAIAFLNKNNLMEQDFVEEQVDRLFSNAGKKTAV